MRRKCHACLCRTCLNVCNCKECKGKIESCENYRGFKQINIFEQEEKRQYRSVPRQSWEYYGISKERYRKLAEYILLSVTQNKSYDALRVKWELKKWSGFRTAGLTFMAGEGTQCIYSIWK